MKYLIFIFGVGVAIYFVYAYTHPVYNQDITIGGHALHVEYALTSEEQQKGLMGRTELSENSGMYFIFSDARVRTFWNKNTLIPLDILWIKNKEVVGTSTLPAESGEIIVVSSERPVDAAIEVNEGWAGENGIKIGDKVN